MAVSPIINKFLTFAATVYVIRTLPVAEYGVYVTVCTYIGLYFVVIDAGLNTLATREIARDHSSANRYFINVTMLRLVLAVAVFILANSVALLLNYPVATTSYIFLFSLFLLTHGIFENYQFVFNGLEAMEYLAVQNIIFSVLASSLYILVVYLGFGIKPLFIIPIILSVIVGMVMYLVIIKKLLAFSWEWDLPFALKLLKDAWPFALMAIFAMIYNKIDIVMLSKLQDEKAVSYYGSAYKLINALLIFASAYTLAIYPVFARLSVNSREKLFFSYKLSFKIMAAFALPLVAGVSLLGREIIILFFKNKYLASVLTLKILIWSVLLTYFTTILLNLIYSFNWQKKTAWIFFITSVLNIMLNFMLIPRYSYLGASVATVICEVFNLAIFYYLVAKKLPGLPWGRVIGKPLLATSVMSLVIFLLKPLVLSNINIYLLPIIVISVIVYWLVYKTSRPFNESEMEQLVKIPLLKNLI